ncbi:hypothetical protein MTO96_005796 [Rhipicephalus appendiculatus]
MRPPFWKTKFYDDPADRQFALRMIGWINWTATRCKNYSDWACGGRGIEASSLAISETAETAAQDYAMEYAIELIERKRKMNSDEPDSVGQETADYDFANMVSVLQACRKGEKKKEDFGKKFSAAFDTSWTVKPTFRPIAEADAAVGSLQDYMNELYFFPLGDVYFSTATDEEAKQTAMYTIFPARFIGRSVDVGYGPYDNAIMAGFKAVSEILPKSCCGDDGSQITGLETAVIKALKVTDEKVIDVGGPETSKLGKGIPDICSDVYGQSQCRFINVNSRTAFGTQMAGKTATAVMNWALLKFVILFSPFLPSDDTTLGPLYQLVSLYYRRAEMPHKDILCMHILERYYSDTLQWLFNKDDYLNMVKANMQEALSKLDSQVSVIGGKGQEDFFSTQLAYAKSPFPPRMIKDVPLKKFFAEYSRIVYFAPETPDKTIKGTTTTDPYSIIFSRAKAVATAKKNGITKKEQCWVGPVFNGEPFQDALHDLMCK